GGSGRLAGFAGCNRVFGTYRATRGGALHISGLALTRRACSASEGELERRFTAALETASEFRVDGDRLEIPYLGGTLRFDLVPPEPADPRSGGGSEARPPAERSLGPESVDA
ncbi:MAG: META domain-containing protein, partial [Gemmatimonadota bacterium]